MPKTYVVQYRYLVPAASSSSVVGPPSMAAGGDAGATREPAGSGKSPVAPGRSAGRFREHTREQAIASFWRRVDQTGDCWLWTGTKDRRGYGQNRSPHFDTSWAHRIAYQITTGPIPAGLVLDHLCRNKSCVNPAHLEPVTIGENVLRGETHTARNQAKTHCPQGHPYDAANTYRDKHGWRSCRACHGLRPVQAPPASESDR